MSKWESSFAVIIHPHRFYRSSDILLVFAPPKK